MQRNSDTVIDKILVIDDDASFRQVIIRFLSKQGFAVVAAADGPEGVRMAAETLPELVVCDLNMPGMDGYEVLGALRRDGKLAGIPVIFLTGQAEPSQVRQGMNLGADDYLTKPVNLGDLLSAIKARIERQKAERQRQEKQMERAMQLFGGIVHDLRDPLFVVLGYTNLLKSGASHNAGQEAPSQILDRMQQAVQRMQSIISETIFLTRSRMQRLPFDPGPFDLQEFCGQLVADHEEIRRLQFQCEAGDFSVVADALRLRQALENVLSNALKYSDGPVLVSLAATTEGYLIAVKDRGIGIPPADQAGIFEPFFRGSNTGGKPGHGLGLTIVKTCLDQHGGKVRFSSEGNQGTTFFLELPKSPPPSAERGTSSAESALATRGSGAAGRDAAREAAVADETAGKPERAGGGPGSESVSCEAAGLRGIIVDDDPLVRGVLRDLLESVMVILGEAGTVAEAILLTRQHRVDVVFLDVNLPDGSGFDLLPHLKPNVSVVFVTSAEEYAVNAFDCEAVDYLLKPVSQERLQKALERVRQRLRARAEAAAAASSKLNDTFLVKTLTERRAVKIGEITRIEAYGEYSWVYWGKGETGALLRKSLKHWLAELPGEQFVRVRREAIVNLACLERIEKVGVGRLQICLRDTAKPILVSLRLVPALNRRLRAIRGEEVADDFRAP